MFCALRGADIHEDTMAIRKMHPEGHRFQEDSRLSYCYDVPNNGKRRSVFLCDCGETKELSFYNVSSGHTKSCGCYNAELASFRSYKLLKKDYVLGKGVCDVEKIGLSQDKSYKTWAGMLKRCYWDGEYKTYKDTTVCDQWLIFSKFMQWFEDNYVCGWELDKDILSNFGGSKTYSPESCCFIPKRLNMFFNQKSTSIGRDLPLGVRLTRNGNYHARIHIDSKEIGLGTYKDPIEAHGRWQIAKASRLMEILDSMKKETSQVDFRIVDKCNRVYEDLLYAHDNKIETKEVW